MKSAKKCAFLQAKWKERYTFSVFSKAAIVAAVLAKLFSRKAIVDAVLVKLL